MKFGLVELLGSLFFLKGANSIELKAPAAITTSYAITLPAAAPGSTQALTIDASGNIGYATPGVGGVDAKDSVRAATTGNITLSGTQTIDGVALAAGDRVLVKDQTTGSANGIYVVAAGAWSRAADADSSAEVTAGMFVFVTEGTTNGDSGWILTTNDAITLGTTALTFARFGSTQAIPILSGGTGATTAAAARSNLGAAGVFRQSFTNASLTAGVLTVTHNLSQYCKVAVYDNNNEEIIPDEVTASSATACTVNLVSFGTLSGTWNVVVVG